MSEPEHKLDSYPGGVYEINTRASGPQGLLPLTPELLRNSPSGDLFGLSQNAGMGWKAAEVMRKPFLILSTQGGLRDHDGTPIALGYHTGHFELDALVRAAAEELHRLELLPFAGFVSDPCDGRSQGTAGMLDSLPYRNDASLVMRRLIRSLPTRRGVIGVATCDKGLPAMTMALAAMSGLPGVVVPGGVTLPPEEGEDAGKVQTLGARYSHELISLEEAAELGCRACATPGGGCQFLGTAATMQVVAEALGMTVPHAALAPSGQPVWRDVAVRSARAVSDLEQRGLAMRDILTPAAIRNAMTVHAAFGGSTNLLLHLPAIAHAAGLTRPTVEDWIEVNQVTPRLVSVLPNGPVDHPTVRVFLAGGVPEVILHLRDSGLIDSTALTASGRSWDEVLDEWVGSERRARFRKILVEQDGVDPDEVIYPPIRASSEGLARTLVFPTGNLAPEGSVVKSTAIDPALFDPDAVFRLEGPAVVFTSEREVMRAIKRGEVNEGEVLVLAGAGPQGTGMEETYQLTSALKHLPYDRWVALLTDARFSGVSTGACIGHVGPEALAGGPIGKLRSGDRIRIEIDANSGEGRVDFVGTAEALLTPHEAARVLAERAPREDLGPRPDLPDDTRLWAALQAASGGTWGGCVYDVERILDILKAGEGAAGDGR
jgi:putative YjhG/YagF family dehydratase